MFEIRRRVQFFSPLLLLLAVFAALPLFAACGDDEDADVAAEADPIEASSSTESARRPSTSPRYDRRGCVEGMERRAEQAAVNAGVIRFIADNSGTETHELVVLKDGKELGEIEGLQKNRVESMSLRLEPGKYELACLIVEKENGKTEDHYTLGMHTEFEVR
jgi:uncharacterized cupredoxin-like copper-binding protein